MTLQIIESPNKTGALKCYANACEAQLPYKYIRQDWDVDHFEAFGALVTVVFMAKYGDVQPSFAVGESVIVKNTTSGDLEMNAIITEIGIFEGKTLIRTDILVAEWTIAGVGYVNQKDKANYRVVLSVWTDSGVQTNPYYAWFNTGANPPVNGAGWVKDSFLIWNVVRNSAGNTAFLQFFAQKKAGERLHFTVNVTCRKTAGNQVNFGVWSQVANAATLQSQQPFAPGGVDTTTLTFTFDITLASDVDAVGFACTGDSIDGYDIHINSFEILENNQSNLLGTEFRYSTNPAGELFVDWGQLLTEYMEEKRLLSFLYTQARREEYDGFVPPADVFTEPTQSIYSWARQLQEVGGSNLWEFVANLAPLGRALTHIQGFEKRGLFWRGWNRTVAFILDDYYFHRIGQTRLQINNNFEDINQGFLNSVLITTTDVSPARLSITSLAEPVADAKYIVVKGLDEILVVPTFTDIYYEIQEECANPIMLDWLNGYGAPEQHLFNINQTFEREAENGLIFERSIQQDIQDTNLTKRRTVRTWRQRMTLEAEGLTKTQFDVLTELKSSDFVRCYLDKTGAEYVEVIIINDLTDGGETDNGKFFFRVEIAFPSNFDFFKGKLY